MGISRYTASSEQARFAHCARVACDAGFMFLLGVLLLPSSPQEEKDATHDGGNGSDTSDNASNYSASVTGAIAGRRSLLSGFGGLIDDSACDDGTALRDDLYARGGSGSR